MTNVDTRQLSRDSLFLLANLKVEGDPGENEYRVKVRNLSSGGMMAEGAVKVARGARVSVELRNIGWVEGSVAWKADDRFGIAFIDEIDPLLARGNPPAGTSEVPRFARAPLARQQFSHDKLRKI
jgi:hypothetical protein